jgi:hypothetical protein
MSRTDSGSWQLMELKALTDLVNIAKEVSHSAARLQSRGTRATRACHLQACAPLACLQRGSGTAQAHSASVSARRRAGGRGGLIAAVPKPGACDAASHARRGGGSASRGRWSGSSLTSRARWRPSSAPPALRDRPGLEGGPACPAYRVRCRPDASGTDFGGWMGCGATAADGLWRADQRNHN